MNSFVPRCPRGIGRRATLVAVALVACVDVSRPQPPVPAGSRIGMVTVGVRVFGNAEQQIIEALKAGEAGTLDHLVKPDFEQRVQAVPGQSVAREDWVRQAAVEASRSAGFRHMAVHDFGNLAVVSFQWLHPAPDFVVDVWQKKPGADDWQLGVRYLSPAPAAAPSQPASAVQRPGRPGRASGSVDQKR